MGYSAIKKFEQKFSVSSGETLSLKTDQGEILVTGTPGNQVSIVAEIKGSPGDLEDFTIAANRIDHGVEIIGRTKSLRWWPWSFDDLDVSYKVEVPREYNLVLQTSGGDISAEQIQGDVRAETSGGGITLRVVKGNVILDTSGGDIMTEQVNGKLKAGTSGGDIVITSATGDVEAETSGGDIRISSMAGKIHSETSGGDITINLLGKGGVFAETSGGDIAIALGKNVGATINASTNGGSVRCDLPVTIQGEFDETELHGTVGGGGEIIHAHTSGGDISLKSTE